MWFLQNEAWETKPRNGRTKQGDKQTVMLDWEVNCTGIKCFYPSFVQERDLNCSSCCRKPDWSRKQSSILISFSTKSDDIINNEQTRCLGSTAKHCTWSWDTWGSWSNVVEHEQVKYNVKNNKPYWSKSTTKTLFYSCLTEISVCAHLLWKGVLTDGTSLD